MSLPLRAPLGQTRFAGGHVAWLSGTTQTILVGMLFETSMASAGAEASPIGSSETETIAAVVGAADILACATTEAPSLSMIGGAVASPLGVMAVATIGTTAVRGAARAVPAGVVVTASSGTAAAKGAARVTAAGVAATASVGAPAARGAALAAPVGVGAMSEVGVAVATGATSGTGVASPLGVEARAYVGSPVATGGTAAVAGQSGRLIWRDSAWGHQTRVPARVAVVGVAAGAAVGVASAHGGARATVPPLLPVRASVGSVLASGWHEFSDEELVWLLAEVA